ncbi:MAG: uncharacterized protein KVP18_004700 [Porospora cf. gigantea A]|uniref:uncharacterized protein n=1 Tax=Porospora cf. gigantea A TaxID=2853593 RepID=UPI003559C838|nr:MAG: hypothetical protein KVP18_004700 [Porospora cf. gigantea A]
MRSCFDLLTDEDKTWLLEPVETRMGKMIRAVETNQALLDILLLSQQEELLIDECECEKNEDLKADSAEKDCDYAEKACDSAENCCDFPERCCEFADRPTPFERQCTAAAADETIERSLEKYSRVQSTLRQFVRDWADEGEKERAMCYGPLIRDLEEYVPIERFRQEHGRRPVVVCPGSGLGRLPFESVRRGYSTQGNEFSHLMLFGADLILNHALPEYELSICPYVLATCNRKSHDDHLVPIRIPNVCPAKHIPRAEDCSFSMFAGEFVEVYQNSIKEIDVVLTSFFLDTAKNIIVYIRTIAKIIRPGGLWANNGPLLYHFADTIGEFSVELSWEEIRPIISLFFDIQHEEFLLATYTSQPRSMMHTVYDCVHFAAIRNDKEVT